MDPPNHGAHQIPENDVEKRGELKATDINVTTDTGSDTLNQYDSPPTPLLLTGKLAKWNAKVERLAGLEARGITRVLPEEKHDGGIHGYLQMVALWFSIDLAATNIITGLLGPLVFQLGWVDCVCIVIFANALSACGASYTSTFGPESGNRTMVRVRAECIPSTRWRSHSRRIMGC
jgi:Permease for cytosine/purines, uracil, thiamine, allantoin